MSGNQNESTACALRWGNDAPDRKLNWTTNLTTLAVFRLLDRINSGRLRVHAPEGVSRVFEGSHSDGPQVEVTVRDPAAFRRLLSRGDIGFAESYFDGQWDTPNLVALMDLVQRNGQALETGLRGGALATLVNRLYHRLRRNSRRGSRRNISQHYDLGNDFYKCWLDPGMTYSSALYERPKQSLAEAQSVKYRRIAELADLRSEHRVLEIGCGWGGFMEHAAARIGCEVQGITLSRQQLITANERMVRRGLDQRARATLTDYRETSGEYDAVVSIEMLEAVGEAHWPDYFRTLRQRLKPGAAAVIQVITIDDQRFDSYRGRTDFIQRHVFPGGMLPCPSVLREQAARAGLMLDHEETFGLSYARTLAEWRERFGAAWPAVARQGFDERFRRLWHYYLCYCEAGFRSGSIDVGIYRFRRPA